MSQSGDIPDIVDRPTVEYSDMPPEIEAVVGDRTYTVEETVKLTWDGNQFLARIPTEIAEELEITKESRMRFAYEKPLPSCDDEPTVVIELLP